MIDRGNRLAFIGRGYRSIENTGKAFDVSVMHLWEFEDGLAAPPEIVLDIPTMQTALLA
jgi:hypothetical protein